MSFRRVRLSLLVLLTASLWACSSNGNSLSGTFSGPITRNDGSVLTAAVSLNQSGTNVSGTITTSAGSTTVYTGTLSGSFDGTTYTFTLTVPTGDFVTAPNCALGLSGTATFTGTTGTTGTTTPTRTLTGSYVGVGSGSCAGQTIDDTFVWTSVG